MIKKYSFEIFKPSWPKWKIRLGDTFLNSITYLGVAKANRMLAKHSHLKNELFIEKVIAEFGHQFEYVGVENIPDSGPVTLVANHPGGADVIGTISSIARKRPDHVILANELICVEPVADIVLPVNTLSKKNKLNMDLVHQAYKEGKVVVFYAAGKNSRYNDKGELRDRKWRATFLDFALQYKTPVSVLRIGGSNAKIFYKVSKFREKRKRLKKVPLENFFQLRELIKPKKEATKLLFSKPIPHHFIEKRVANTDIKSKRELADEMYDFLYSMSENNLEFKSEEG